MLESFNHPDLLRPPRTTRAVVSQLYSPPVIGDEKRGSGLDDNGAYLEGMHISCKALTILVKYCKEYILPFMELIVTRLMLVASFAPIAITFQCEQLLNDLALMDVSRFIPLIIPYASITDQSLLASTIKHGEALDYSAIRLLALHLLASTIKNMPSPLLLIELNKILEHILPCFGSEIVDMRKAVVFVLVELYAIIGDALYPYITHLTPPQKKLLAIYIQRFNQSKKSY